MKIDNASLFLYNIVVFKDKFEMIIVIFEMMIF